MKRLQYHTREHIIEKKQVGEVLYLSYPILEQSGIVKHGFSTRIGGVSKGIYASMNLSYSRGDEDECVRENFRRMGEAIGVRVDQMVRSAQTHTTNVFQVTAQNRHCDLQDIDALITDEPDICLVTSYADCVPLFFVDTEHGAIGLAHSGWRGTVGKIGQVTLQKMKEAYGTKPEEVLCAIGPSICQQCYEVSEDVIEQFKAQFRDVYWEELFYPSGNQKFQLNLWKANEIILREAGVSKEHLAITNVCTCCNQEVLFSHRASKGQRGGLAAFLALK